MNCRSNGGAIAMTEKAEFEELKTRLRNAEKYFDTKYLTDTPENQQRAEKAFQKIIDRMSELLKLLNKTIELDASKTCEELAEEIRRLEAAMGMRAGAIICYRRSKRLFVRLEPCL